LLLFLAIAATAVAEIKPKHITGTIVERYYPVPDNIHVTHLVISDGNKLFLVVGHPNFPNLAIDDPVAFWAVPGSVHEETGRRTYYYASRDEPRPDQLKSIADRIWAKYSDKITGNP
jgi:hypothetical protein